MILTTKTTPWRKRAIIALAVIALCIGLVVIAHIIAGRDVNISVTVIDAETGEPVPRAAVMVGTKRYGLFDDSWFAFAATTDDAGRASVKQRVGYVIRRVSVQAFGQEMSKYGSQSRQFLFPAQGHYEVKLHAVKEAERKEIRRRHDVNADRATHTQYVLELQGIEPKPIAP